MSQELMRGILIGAGTTTFGFVLTMAWDVWKTRQERKSLQGNLLNLLSDELEHNALVVRENKSLIEQELNSLEEGRSLIKALAIPEADFWEVFKQNYDYKFFPTEKAKLVKDIYSKIHSIIVNIESRENYRISNGAMTSFSNKMTRYDNILLNLLNEFEVLYKNFGSQKS